MQSDNIREIDLKQLCNIKKAVVSMVYKAKSSHVGSCLSIVDILHVLYFKILSISPSDPTDSKRDKFILSKGHGSAALYATLAEKGFFPREHLSRFFVDDGLLPGHLDMQVVPGIEVSVGSLGHGLPIGVGMAIANKQMLNPGKIYVLLGDGECNEGSVWEAIMLASTLKLDNITAIVDFNKLQGFGRTNEVIDQKNMSERWRSFGWMAIEIDGHNLTEIEDALKQPHLKIPKVIIANTIKGKGVSFMEDRLEWHYKNPTEEQYKQAIKELESQYEKRIC